MRRLALIFALIATSVAGLAASASGDDVRTYYIELDNAFGLVKGSPVKVAGVEAGVITDFQINSQKRAVAKVELAGPVSVLGQDTICSTDPQSLIAEYFIDCTPKGPPIETFDGSEEEHAEKPDIPVDQTRQTVQQDLVLTTAREPFRERLTLLINEFGTALAGNGDNLNAAIRRGAPALEETEKVFNLLASQNTIIRDLNVNSDRIISRLNESREDVVDFIDEAENTARISAEVRDELGQNFALLDDFLLELRPTMADLNGLAVQGTPLARDLRLAAPGLTELSRDLPAFNAAGTDALVSLGKTSVVGQRALDKGQDEIKQLADTAKNSFSPANNLAKFLRDIDDPNRAVEEDARAAVDTGRPAAAATPAWRDSSTTSTTSRSRSTSSTRSGISCTSRSSKWVRDRAPTTAPASTTPTDPVRTRPRSAGRTWTAPPLPRTRPRRTAASQSSATANPTSTSR